MTIEAATKVLTIFVLVFAFLSLLYTIGRMKFGVFVFVVSSCSILFSCLKSQLTVTMKRQRRTRANRIKQFVSFQM